MDSGLNYGDANSTDNFVRYIRAMAQVMRDNQMGGTYWPALGGKPGTIGYDWYSMYAQSGSGTNLNLTVRNASGAEPAPLGVGRRGRPGRRQRRRRRRPCGSSTGATAASAMDVVGGSTANGAEIIQYTCGGARQPAVAARRTPATATERSSPRTAASAWT